MSMNPDLEINLDLVAAGAPDLSATRDHDTYPQIEELWHALVRSVLDEHREHHLDVASNCWSGSCRIASAIEART